MRVFHNYQNGEKLEHLVHTARAVNQSINQSNNQTIKQSNNQSIHLKHEGATHVVHIEQIDHAVLACEGEDCAVWREPQILHAVLMAMLLHW